ncbi:hypothetical protein [Haladaptatus sp. ZSTT2]|uniref:hypothetical protein n=1 Tax=Haladaptatus sp. ZSTT2 TaxID=3120515 RepID=UPI00300ED37B
MEHHKSNLREGRTFVWKNNCIPEIGNLVCELEKEVELSKLLSQTENEGNSTRDEDIGKEIPYTMYIREATERIGDQASLLNQLESDYKSIVKYRRRIGGVIFSLCIDTAIIGYLYSGSPISDEKIIFLIILCYTGTIFFIILIYLVMKLLRKQERLGKYADEHERVREI